MGFHPLSFKGTGRGSEPSTEGWLAFGHLCGQCVLAQLLVWMVLVSFVVCLGIRFSLVFANKLKYAGVLPGSAAQK